MSSELNSGLYNFFMDSLHQFYAATRMFSFMNDERIQRNRVTWQSAAALACFIGSVLSLGVGFVFTTGWILNAQLHPLLHGVGVVLLIVGIPILILGGHFMDLRERKTKESDKDPPVRDNGGPKPLHVVVGLVAFFSVLCIATGKVQAQQTSAIPSSIPTSNTKVGPNIAGVSPESSERERLLLMRIDQLEKRLATLESRLAPSGDAESNGISSTVRRETEATLDPVAIGENRKPQTSTPQNNPVDEEALGFLRDTTFNLTLDGYYGYNFNRSVGGINLLRAYDVQSNSFSLNQAALIIENAPNLEKGKRYGLRLDLQYGQATETVQGNAANEPRPQVYRNLWQAYGTYVFDVGKGLTVDFGKFGGALGYETNYTKDNFNYTRAYFFNFLPFYHFGFRSSYAFNDKVTLTHWLVNGVQQSEDFNGFKSQALLLTWKPTPRITSQFNYYIGQEQRDRNPALNPTFAPVASQPGLSIDVIRPVPSGRFHVLDTYHTFNVTDKLTLAVEGDYVVGRVFRESAPATVWGGVGYARYQWTPKFAIAGRFEYLSEKVSPAGGLFSGVSQALKEHTVTAEYKFADGFLGRAEYRRDFSNQPFFLTEQPGILKKEQNTATLGLVWWFGRKQGTW